MEPSLHHSIFGKAEEKDIQPLSAFFLSASYFFQIYPLLIIACTPGIFNSEILFSFPFSDKIFCDIQQVMNRRNISRGVAQPNLSAPPAALIYRAVLCCIFTVSLSIIHETQIPFTFFRDFLKKVFGALSVSQSSTAGVKPLSHGLRRDSSPSRGALGRPSRFRGLALRSFWQCWRNVRPCGR